LAERHNSCECYGVPAPLIVLARHGYFTRQDPGRGRSSHGSKHKQQCRYRSHNSVLFGGQNPQQD
jgi:hypothetical protein